MYPARKSGFPIRFASSPATTTIVGAIAVSFLISFFTNGQALFPQLVFLPALAPQMPWTLLTYPLAYPPTAFVSVLFIGLWLYSMGGSVESELGSWKFVSFWLVMTLLGALMLWLGSVLTGVGGMSSALYGAFMPVAAVTVAWGTRNPHTTVLVMFVLPLKGMWIAWISAALVFFGTSAQLAPFTAIPLLLAYLFAAGKLPGVSFSSSQRRSSRANNRQDRKRDLEYKERVRAKEAERQERERLRKLFENSLKDDEDR